MTTPHDASATAAVDERLQQIRERLDALNNQRILDFREHEVYLSDADVAFNEHADADIRFLLDELARRDRDNASLRAQLAAATARETTFAATLLGIANLDYWHDEMQEVARRALEAATPPAGEANEEAR